MPSPALGITFLETGDISCVLLVAYSSTITLTSIRRPSLASVRHQIRRRATWAPGTGTAFLGTPFHRHLGSEREIFLFRGVPNKTL